MRMSLLRCISISLAICLSAIYILSTTEEIIGFKINTAYNQEKLSLQNNENMSPCDNTINLQNPSKSSTDESAEEQLQSILTKWKNKASVTAKETYQNYNVNYKNNGLPTREYPFIFFHQRKAGGTTFKEHLFKISTKKKKPSYIASHGNVQWGTFTIPNRANQKKESYAIYAGHFNYMHVYSNIAIRDANEFLSKRGVSVNPTPFSCLINARPTMERVFSCWNYFFLQELKLYDKLPNAYNMTPSQWDTYLPFLYSKFRQGCNNEFIRNFSDESNEILVNNLIVSEDVSVMLQNVLESVLERVSQCSIMLLPKCQESVSVVNHYHPWLDLQDNYCEVKYNVGKEEPKSVEDDIPKDVQDVISKWNRMDDLVYEYLEVLFEEQYKLSLS